MMKKQCILTNPKKYLGAFHKSLTDYEIRIDYTQHNISSILEYYKILSNEDRLIKSNKH